MPDNLAPLVLHLPSSYLPWTVGGKEVYTAGLARHLERYHWQSAVAFHQTDETNQTIGCHKHGNTAVHILPPLADRNRRSAVYGCAPAAVPGFDEFLCRHRPAILHLHDFSISANLLHIRAAQARGAKIVMTYHAPGQSCLQRSLRYRSSTICDGEIRTHRCTACRIGAAGKGPLVSGALAAIPWQGSKIDKPGLVSRAATARLSTQLFHAAWQEMVARVDTFQVLANWSIDVLLRNGVPREKIRLIRSGVNELGSQPSPSRTVNYGQPLRIAFVGRCDPVKGAHVLIDAIRRVPQALPLEVSFFGPYWDSEYARDLKHRIAGDHRFRAPRLIEPAQIVAMLERHDLCIIPSLWLETGPLVVLEAFAAGIPVLGSRLGGIAEWVTDGVDGWLFEPGDAEALAQHITKLAGDPTFIAKLTKGVTRPRSMADTAKETSELYRELLNHQHAEAANAWATTGAANLGLAE